MSKMSIKKFRKNDYSHEEDDFRNSPSEYLLKRKEKRVERALKTKDISSLIEDEDFDYDDDYDKEWYDR